MHWCLPKLHRNSREVSLSHVGDSSPADSTSTLCDDHKSDPDTKDPRGIRTGEKLSALRKLMKDEPEPLDYYIIPSADAHQSEYIAVVDARVEYISDFTGSSALAIVSTASAHLFVDSRYWIQAARETDNKYWTVHRVGAPGEKSWTEWIKQDANPKSTFGVDARLISYKTVPQLFSGISERGSRLLFPQTNLIDASRSDQPPLPNNPITVHPLKYAGQPASAKIKQIREWLVSQQRSPERSSVFEVLPGELPDESGYPSKTSHTFADVAGVTATLTGVVLYALDTIAWTLNLRGEDVPFNPVFFAYLIITQEEAILFTEAGKIESQSVQSYLEALGVAIRPYERVWSYLQSDELKATMILDSNTPYAVAASVTRPRYTVINYSYVTNLKGIKNDTEIGGFRAAYLRDAAAFVQWLAWLEEAIVKKKKSVTEWEAALQLGEYRKQLDHYRGLAYGDISATGANAALPHYTPSDKDSPMIETSTPYLMDSGGQYLDGTCDTTRTVHFGDPTKEQREAYTRVLQGHIAIETAVFPSGTTGAQLDVLARKALWKDGMNYGHGTGHGFGSFLSVHEGPHGFGYNIPLRAGNVITNEPGFYKEGEFGIRIESALLVGEVKFGASGDSESSKGQELPWFKFERFTQVPIQASRLISFSLLTKEERKWLRDHNKSCLENLKPVLKHDKRAMSWLKKQTGKVGPIEIFWE